MNKIIITVCLIYSSYVGFSQENTFEFQADDFLTEIWTHSNNNEGVDSVLVKDNQKIFSMTRLSNNVVGANIAYLNNIDFKNGIIECDIFSPVDKGKLSFIGIVFRAKDSTQYECVYFRPFVSGTVHAIQYMPIVVDGIVNWQDYRVEAYKAIGILPEQDWFHVKLEVVDADLKVYVNNSKEPQMHIKTLGLGTKTGKVGFWLGNSKNVYFKNLMITMIDDTKKGED